jgi:hypothetical protein
MRGAATRETQRPGQAEPEPITSVAFYCVADSRHFLGVVALINSLRLQNHWEPIFVLDCGLSADERSLLKPHATIVPSPPTEAPHLVKCIAPLLYPTDVMVLVDADLIVTRSLAPLVEQAASTCIVAFADALDTRFDDRWSALLGLGELRRQTYVNSGLMAIPQRVGIGLLERLGECAARVDVQRSLYREGVPSDPFYFLDQDIVNALLASEVQPQELMVLEHRLAPHPPFQGLELVDEDEVHCAYADDTQPFVLHHIQQKPWLRRMPPTIYSRLLSRLWLGSDVALRLSADQVPLRFRRGLAPDIIGRWNAGRIAFTTARRRLGLRRY